MSYSFVDTEWGAFLFSTTPLGLRHCLLPDPDEADPHRLAERHWKGQDYVPHLMPSFQKEVQHYFEGRPVHFFVTLDLSDYTPFQQRVLLACHEIPFGRALTYAELARASGFPRASRAVGSVMSHNPMPLVIPCHRVVRSDGGLGGFSSPCGTSQKHRLLEHEGVLMSEIGPGVMQTA